MDERHSLTSGSITGSDISTAAQRPSGEIATPPTRLAENASSGVQRASGACTLGMRRRAQKAAGTRLQSRPQRVACHGIHDTDRRLARRSRSEEHTSELQSQSNLVCRLLLEKKKKSELHA